MVAEGRPCSSLTMVPSLLSICLEGLCRSCSGSSSRGSNNRSTIDVVVKVVVVAEAAAVVPMVVSRQRGDLVAALP